MLKLNFTLGILFRWWNPAVFKHSNTSEMVDFFFRKVNIFKDIKHITAKRPNERKKSRRTKTPQNHNQKNDTNHHVLRQNHSFFFLFSTSFLEPTIASIGMQFHGLRRRHLSHRIWEMGMWTPVAPLAFCSPSPMSHEIQNKLDY